MKQCIVLLLLLGSLSAPAQTWAEFMQQKKTQKKYLLQQIAALQTYLGHLRKGYDVVDGGLRTIGRIKDDEWGLHIDYFGSLKAVNPALKRTAKVMEILSLQARIVKSAGGLLKGAKGSGHLTSGEMATVQTTCNNLMAASLKSIEDLGTVLTAGELSLSDDERLRRIQALHTDMQSQHQFLVSFGSTVLGVMRIREKEALEIQLSKKLNSLK